MVPPQMLGDIAKNVTVRVSLGNTVVNIKLYVFHKIPSHC